jgi:hypothetical protein
MFPTAVQAVKKIHLTGSKQPTKAAAIAIFRLQLLKSSQAHFLLYRARNDIV